jgi:hypothetical protein
VVVVMQEVPIKVPPDGHDNVELAPMLVVVVCKQLDPDSTEPLAQL